jgi:hypothetical protein
MPIAVQGTAKTPRKQRTSAKAKYGQSLTARSFVLTTNSRGCRIGHRTEKERLCGRRSQPA